MSIILLTHSMIHIVILGLNSRWFARNLTSAHVGFCYIVDRSYFSRIGAISSPVKAQVARLNGAQEEDLLPPAPMATLTKKSFAAKAIECGASAGVVLFPDGSAPVEISMEILVSRKMESLRGRRSRALHLTAGELRRHQVEYYSNFPAQQGALDAALLATCGQDVSLLRKGATRRGHLADSGSEVHAGDGLALKAQATPHLPHHGDHRCSEERHKPSFLPAASHGANCGQPFSGKELEKTLDPTMCYM